MRNIQPSAKPCNGTDAYVHWSTSRENGLSHFEIERSPCGRNWQNIGNVPAAGISHQQHRYKFIDEFVFTPFEQKCALFYYRIKTVTMAGKSEYSRIAKVSFQTLARPITVKNSRKKAVKIYK